ncbi:hypothetical protein D920_01462 [Enterococcus faecalis 13-SD-W-01]|nr:hypothetical protein D920_01462 [Enterococcus faecalis 13-SD-W-01]
MCNKSSSHRLSKDSLIGKRNHDTLIIYCEITNKEAGYARITKIRLIAKSNSEKATALFEILEDAG